MLVPCPACSRHVRSSEASCPFCRSDLPAGLAARAVPSTTRRLDRLARFTFAASIALAACGGKSVDPIENEKQAEGAPARPVGDDREDDENSYGGTSGWTGGGDMGGMSSSYGGPPIQTPPPPPPTPRDAGSDGSDGGM